MPFPLFSILNLGSPGNVSESVSASTFRESSTLVSSSSSSNTFSTVIIHNISFSASSSRVVSSYSSSFLFTPSSSLATPISPLSSLYTIPTVELLTGTSSSSVAGRWSVATPTMSPTMSMVSNTPDNAKAGSSHRSAIIAGTTTAAVAFLLIAIAAGAFLYRRLRKKAQLRDVTMGRRKSFDIYPRAEDEDEWEVLSHLHGVDHGDHQRDWNHAKSPHYMLRSRGAPDYWDSAPHSSSPLSHFP
ncbi:hypothetical protein B0H11DRAFT_2200294 [Mycena galericulata]|nr:hypothetical protein B0H11DRAFT_2209905 [Mycena galericulata]KAJ7455615.1 hypothetical protein B0H11DRAFT_2200294 [Mycena galericulata]